MEFLVNGELKCPLVNLFTHCAPLVMAGQIAAVSRRPLERSDQNQKPQTLAKNLVMGSLHAELRIFNIN